MSSPTEPPRPGGSPPPIAPPPGPAPPPGGPGAVNSANRVIGQGYGEGDAAGFTPPSGEQMKLLLQSHPPTGPSPLMAWAPLLLLGLALVLSFTMREGPLVLLPWFPLIGVFVFLGIRVRLYRSLEARVAYLQELAMVRRWTDALRFGWQLLPDLYISPEMHGRSVVAMAYCLDQVRAYDAAIVSFDYLIARLPSEHPGALQLRLQRTLAQLGNDQLSDADDSLRKLRGVPHIVDVKKPNAARATYRLANLLQQVRTYHYAEAVHEADGMLDDLRPLGIEAGYGHALLALSFHQLHLTKQGQNDEKGPTQEQARHWAGVWWSRATRLLSPAALLFRFKELQPLVDDEAMQSYKSTCTPPIGPGKP